MQLTVRKQPAGLGQVFRLQSFHSELEQPCWAEVVPCPTTNTRLAIATDSCEERDLVQRGIQHAWRATALAICTVLD